MAGTGGDYHAFDVPASGPTSNSRSARGCSGALISFIAACSSFASIALFAYASGAGDTEQTSRTQFQAWLVSHQAYASTVDEVLLKGEVQWKPPPHNTSHERCAWVVDIMTTRDSSKSYDMRHNKYTSQSNDANTFFRATPRFSGKTL